MKKLPVILSLTLLIFSFFSCDFTVNFMLNDYNGNFQQPAKTAEGVTPQPGDDDFFPEDMLFDRYIVYSDGTLNLSGPSPSKVTSYTWTMFDPEVEDEANQVIDVCLMGGFSTKTQRYVFYTPESGLEEGKTYQLQLRVEATNKRTYKDVCEVSVIKTYHTTSNSRSLIQNQNIHRTIMPTQENSLDGLTYWLEYKDANDAEAVSSFTKINQFQTMLDKGHFNIPLDEKCYSMTLYAVKDSSLEESNVKANAVLSATSVADLRYSSEVNFYLSSQKTELAGTVKLKLYTKGWETDGDTTVAVEITDLTDNPVSVTPTLNLTSISNDSTISSPNYEIELSPGSYNFNLCFTKNSKKYTWTDKLIVTSGCNINKTIGIPNVISSGRKQFKFYTNGWNFGTEDSIESVTIKYTGGTDTITPLREITSLTKENIGTDATTEVNYDIELETGKYTALITFKYMNCDFEWGYNFETPSGTTTIESVPIPKPDISGKYQLIAYPDTWDPTAYDGLTVAFNIKQGETEISVPSGSTEITLENFKDSSSTSETNNLEVELEPGTYKLNVIFTYESNEYIWDHDFTISAKQITEEKIGIPNLISGGASP